MGIEVLVFLVVAAASIAATWALARRRERVARETLARAVASRLDEPSSLHPVIDPARCIGTAACVAACPEGGVLGIVSGRAVLVDPARCIGHGACYAACPTGAIRLVFGTARRGVEIPHVRPNFETNVAGVFIAGELGGMGLVRNAMVQGIQAVEGMAPAARAERLAARDDVLDLAIVGAGPAGLAAALAARAAKLRYVTLEQEALGGTVYHYPRRKMVITRPIELPGYGTIREREIRKEELLALWHDVIERSGIEIRLEERVTDVTRENDAFAITTRSGCYRARRVILAIGRRGAPRKLGVPGEEAAHVSYALPEPAEVRDEAVLVVGGGSSALEAAIALVTPARGNRVTLCHRGDAFARATDANREAVEALEREGRLVVLRRCEVEQIVPAGARLQRDGRALVVPADRVLALVGGTLPIELLQRLGVAIDVKFGTP